MSSNALEQNFPSTLIEFTFLFSYTRRDVKKIIFYHFTKEFLAQIESKITIDSIFKHTLSPWKQKVHKRLIAHLIIMRSTRVC